MSDKMRVYFGKGIPVAAGFDLNAQTPLDARTVVQSVADLDTMDDIKKYEGLMVFVKDTKENYQCVLKAEPGEGSPFEFVKMASAADIAGDISGVEAKLTQEIKDRQAGDKAIMDIIGENEAPAEGTIKKDIADLKAADTAITGRLDVIEGVGEGSINKALADSKAYTDTKVGEVNSKVDTKVGELEQADTAIKGRLDAIETSLGEGGDIDTRVTALETTVGNAGSGLVKDVNDLKTGLETKANLNGDPLQDFSAKDLSVANNLTVSGNLTVNGTTTTVNSEDLIVKDNLIHLNDGETGEGVTKKKAGIQIDRGTAADGDYVIVFDEEAADGKLKVGKVKDNIYTTQSVATEDWVNDKVDTALEQVHTHENKAILDATTASYTTEEKAKLAGISAEAKKVEVLEGKLAIDGVPTNIDDVSVVAEAKKIQDQIGTGFDAVNTVKKAVDDLNAAIEGISGDGGSLQTELDKKLDKTEVTTTAEANKVLRLDENSQLKATAINSLGLSGLALNDAFTAPIPEGEQNAIWSALQIIAGLSKKQDLVFVGESRPETFSLHQIWLKDNGVYTPPVVTP